MRHFFLSGRFPRALVGPLLSAALLLTGIGIATTATAAVGVSINIANGFNNTINPGDATTFEIVLTNNNASGPITGVSLTDSMPGFNVVGIGVTSYQCIDGETGSVAVPGTGTLTAAPGSSAITLTGGIVPKAKAGGASGSCTIDVQVTAYTPPTVTNTIQAGGVTATDAGGGALTNPTAVSQSVSINTLSNPTITKSFSTGTVVTNDDRLVLTLIISNPNNISLPLNGASDSPAWALHDVLPAPLQVAPSPQISSTCTNAGTPPTVTAVAGATVITALDGSVAANSTCTVSVHLIAAPIPGTYTSSIINTVNGTTDFGNKRGLAAPNTSANLTVNSILSVEKLFNPTTIAAGQESTLTITLKNGSPVNTITLTSLDDAFIDGGAGARLKIRDTGPGALSTTCGGAVTAINANGGLHLSGGSIAPNSSCTINVPFKGTLATTGVPQSFTNTIAQGAVVTSDPTTVSSQAVHSVTVVDQLLVTKTASPTVVAPGGLVRYGIAVSNFAAAPLINVQITDVLPTGMSIVNSPVAPAVSGTGCGTLSNIGSASSPIFQIAVVPSGAGASPGVCTVTFWTITPIDPASPAALNNAIARQGVTSNGGSGPTNDAPSNNTTATLSANATLSKVFNPQNTSEGTVSLLTIKLTNISANPLTNATFTDNLPTGVGGAATLLQIANPSSATTTCGGTLTAVPGNSIVTLTGGTIPGRGNNGLDDAFGTCVVQVKVVGAAGTYTNTLPPAALTATETYANAATHAINSPGPVSAAITYNVALGASKSFFPTQIAPGGKSTLRINLSNASSGVLNSVVVHDPMPANMTVATPSNARSTCAGVVDFSATVASAFDARGMIVPALGNCDVVFDVIGTGGSDWVNTIPPGSISAAGGVKTLTAVTATLANRSGGGVSVAINVAPSALPAPGASALLTITIQNFGTLSLNALSLNNYFTSNGLASGTPTGLVLAATPNFTLSNCTGGIATAGTGNAAVLLSGVSLPAGVTCTVTANVTMTTSGSVVDMIPVGAVTDAEGISNTGAVSTSLQAQASTGIIKSFTPSVVKPGDRARLRLTFFNPNVIPLLSLEVIDTFPTSPASMTVATGGGNPSTTCAGAVVDGSHNTSVEVSGGSLPAGTPGSPSTCYAEIDVVTAAAGSYVNTIPAGALTGTIGGGPTDNDASASATLQVRSPVSIAKNFSPNQVKPGVSAVLTITLTNPNGVALNAAALTDNLPANVVIAQSPNHQVTTCTGGAITAPVSATSITLTGGVIPANSSCTVKTDVVSNIAGVYLNTIPAGALTTQEGITNDLPATDTLKLLDPPTVNKQFAPVSVASGGISKLTIVLGNTNIADATLNTALVDTLPISPGPILVASPNNLVNTCPGTPVAVAGSGTVTYPSGAKIPANGCSFTIDVTGAVQGAYNNFIAAGALTTDFGNNPDPANANLQITPLGSISGRVFKDNNVVPNGLFDGSGATADAGIANVVVTLTGVGFGPDGLQGTGDDAAVSLVTTTDALGNYAFVGLNAGLYTVAEPTQPTGTLNGITMAGAIIGTGGGIVGAATAVSTVPSAIGSGTQIRLNRDAGTGQVSSSPNNNFAEVVPSSLAGIVFLDLNNNGLKDLTDTPLTGVAIQLVTTGTNIVVAIQTTDANGAYSFTNVPPGSYYLKEPTQPANTVNGITTAGSTANGGAAGTGTASSVAISQINGIVLPPNTNSTGNNFAELPSGRQISGRVYMDANDNGIVDAGEAPLAGVTLNLTGTDVNGNAVTATTVTDANGRYIFMGLAEGSYSVTEPAQPPRSSNGKTTTPAASGGAASNPTTTSSLIAGIALTGLTTVSIDNNFGEIPLSTGLVSGKVYVDANNNGVIDAGEVGIAGVTVTLTGTTSGGAAVNLTLTTAGDGSYAFPPVLPSDASGYVISETQPSLYTDGKTTIAAGNPGIASTVKPVTSNNLDIIRGVKVIAGDVLPNYNFGELSAGIGLIPPIVNGYVYLDKNHNRTRVGDGGQAGQAGWTVQLKKNGTLICTVITNSIGFYQFDNQHCPGYETGLPTSAAPDFSIEFSKDGNHLPAVPTATAGTPNSTNGSITGITLLAGAQVVEENLPLDPSGVVYDSSSRQPVAGAVVTITGPVGFDPAAMLTTGSPTQTTGSDGLYAFFLQNGFPNGVYSLSVVAPAGYNAAPSTVLPACVGTAIIALLPDPARIQASDNAPAQSVPQANPAACVGALGTGANSTQYYFSFNITNGGSAPILNNHIPLDPMGSSQILITKTTPLVNVSRGDLVPYTITATNTLANPIANVAVRDQIPPGFKYRIGSASLNGAPLEPTVAGRVLTWPAQTFTAKEKKIYRLILIVGSGVADGKYVNQGWGFDFASGFMLSNLATATVNVVPDPTFDCPDVIGKVFDDQNANGYQDEGEPGIPAVRVVTARGLLVMTDAEGRFHVPCPEVPNPDRGSNFVMKLDVRTLPSGYRMTTENPRDVRLTRGKVTKLNFGATIHRVVRLELSDSAFLPNSDTLQPRWQKQMDALPDTLKLRPSVVRLAYQRGSDSTDLMQKRIDAIGKQIKARWTARKGQYALDIETEDAQ
jgi:uncharacterized repeat protein (TIGR01451 family)